MTSNYIWRGLTQTENEAAVQGGIDYSGDNGFYIGTWASNVNYGPSDVYSYEHDVYAGFAFDTGAISWDVGYLYYNYDKEANFDFGEVYVGAGIGGFSAKLNVLANTEADEEEGQDFGFGEAYYLSLDYGFEIGNGVGIGLHIGHHDGDFAEAFNGRVGAECLNAYWFLSLDDARVKCEAWRRDYNEHRPHSSLGNQTPMERAFASGQACLP